MEAEQRRAAKEQMIALMQAGYRWQAAAAQAGIQISLSFDRLSAAAPGAHAWESCFPGWQTWAPRQTAHGRANMAGKLLPHVAPHFKPRGAGGPPGTVRHPDQYVMHRRCTTAHEKVLE